MDCVSIVARLPEAVDTIVVGSGTAGAAVAGRRAAGSPECTLLLKAAPRGHRTGPCDVKRPAASQPAKDRCRSGGREDHADEHAGTSAGVQGRSPGSGVPWAVGDGGDGGRVGPAGRGVHGRATGPECRRVTSHRGVGSLCGVTSLPG